MSSCASCHSDGLTDNITWAFNAGPRQSVSLDGSFSKGKNAGQQRIFNWSGIFDEVHDFERNIRAVQGGVGAMTVSPSKSPSGCGKFVSAAGQIKLNEASRAAFFAPPPNPVPTPSPAPEPQPNLNLPFREVQNLLSATEQQNVAPCPANGQHEWDAVEAWIKSLRPPRARKITPRVAESAQRGRSLFAEGKCNNCHGGSGWTISKLFWPPSKDVNKTFFPPQGAANASALGILKLDAGVATVECVLRTVDTFDININADETDGRRFRELKVNGTPAAGALGFNVPSLYGLATGAPYFHHGQAENLVELLTDERWSGHLRAGNPGFLADLSDEQRLQAARDLGRFLLTIDAKTEEIEPEPGSVRCTEVR